MWQRWARVVLWGSLAAVLAFPASATAYVPYNIEELTTDLYRNLDSYSDLEIDGVVANTQIPDTVAELTAATGATEPQVVSGIQRTSTALKVQGVWQVLSKSQRVRAVGSMVAGTLIMTGVDWVGTKTVNGITGPGAAILGGWLSERSFGRCAGNFWANFRQGVFHGQCPSAVERFPIPFAGVCGHRRGNPKRRFQADLATRIPSNWPTEGESTYWLYDYLIRGGMAAVSGDTHGPIKVVVVDGRSDAVFGVSLLERAASGGLGLHVHSQDYG